MKNGANKHDNTSHKNKRKRLKIISVHFGTNGVKDDFPKKKKNWKNNLTLENKFNLKNKIEPVAHEAPPLLHLLDFQVETVTGRGFDSNPKIACII